MTRDDQAGAAGSGSLIDLTPTVGSFFILSKQGRLFALNDIRMSADFARFTQSVYTSDQFGAIYPLIGGVRASGIVLVVHPPLVYYLMHAQGSGAEPRRVFGSTADVIAQSLDSNTFPILALIELERALMLSRKKKTPLSIRVRFLELKSSVPEDWVQQLKELFHTNTRAPAEKASRLTRQLERLGNAIRNTLFSQYLAKCMWQSVATREFGRLVGEGGRVSFEPYNVFDTQVRSFMDALAELDGGGYQAKHDVARMLPNPVKQGPWACPTLQIHDERFRRQNQLDEYYSLYQGLRVLSAIGAPVLLFEGQDPMVTPTRVSVLRVSERTPEAFQAVAREFPSRALVWTDADQAPDSIDPW